jgi:hypothetical protein
LLALYKKAIEVTAIQKKKPELVRLDEWLWKDLSESVKSRSPAHLTKEELSDLMRWKLIRGKFRPLQGLVDSNSAVAVEAATAKAMKCLSQRQWKASLKELCVLKGIGVATASAIVALFCPDECAFMADEVIETTCPRRDYTLAVYCVLQQSLATRQHQLQLLVLAENEAEAASSSSGGGQGSKRKCGVEAGAALVGGLSCEDMGKALWTAAVLSVHEPALYGRTLGPDAAGGAHQQEEPDSGHKRQKL